ncbi:NAD(P)/FAD-dependent oxidoreductase [Variovorax sp. KK3]|uniref:FAD/NAD(P)-dependent oxidoreductase n=1 Tax=Variovorax sp. KK3 TaxID=1855728 RepID=UPI00097CB8A7|nr:FAD/NAD(P)-binding oxidoreductase [Variovorax sp. KK3]
MAFETSPHATTERPMQTADAVIVGAGPAGMAAAIAMRQHGASVVLLDEQPAAGGQIYRGITNAPAERLDVLGPDYGAGAALAGEFARSGARHVTGAAVWQVTAERQVHYLQSGGVHSIQAERVLLCTGAMERPFPIPGWTLPGVLTAGAAQILLKGSGMAPSQPVVLAGCGPLLYLLGWQYVRAGVPIAAIVDTTDGADYRRAIRHAGGALAGWRYLQKGLALMGALKKAGVPFFKGATGLHVLGDDKASGLGFTSGGTARTVQSPLVLLHQGVVPNTQFSWSLRARHIWDDAQLCWSPVTDTWGELDVPGVFVAGDSSGIGGARVAALQGELAGLAAASQTGKLPAPMRDRLAEPLRAEMRQHLFIRPFLDALYRPKKANRIPSDGTIVCRCEEVTAGDIRGYVDIGCTGPNQAKSFGRCGMGPCQGRQCGLTVTEVIADARGVTPEETGYFRIRPPIKPITLGELAHEA